MNRVKFLLPILLVLAGSMLWSAFRLKGDPPKVGDPAPTFTLVSNEGTEVMLSEQKGKWVLLYFYPKDFTSGCTIEARNFQRDIEQYEAANTIVLGVSFDNAERHAEFCEKEGLSFKLLADTEGTVSEAYGSVRGVGPARVSARNSFLIDPTGKVAKVYMGVNPNTHSEDVLTDLAALQAG